MLRFPWNQRNGPSAKTEDHTSYGMWKGTIRTKQNQARSNPGRVECQSPEGSAACAWTSDLARFSRDAPRHFLSHEKENLQILFMRFAHEAAKLVKHSFILARASPCDIIADLSFRKIEKLAVPSPS